MTEQLKPFPRVSGIGRDNDHPSALVIYLASEPTDEDIRAIQGALRDAQAGQQEPVGEVTRWHISQWNAQHPSMAGEHVGVRLTASGAELPEGAKLYATPQPAPDTAALVDALELCSKALASVLTGGEVSAAAAGRALVKSAEVLAAFRAQQQSDDSA